VTQAFREACEIVVDGLTDADILGDGSLSQEMSVFMAACSASPDEDNLTRRLGAALHATCPSAVARVLLLSLAHNPRVQEQKVLFWGALLELCETELTESKMRGCIATYFRGMFTEAGLSSTEVCRYLNVPSPALAKRK
jgi:hypothetical protein